MTDKTTLNFIQKNLQTAVSKLIDVMKYFRSENKTL